MTGTIEQTASAKPRTRRSDHYETVAVTALPPGWRNVFTEPDGSVITTPCPAILVQELRAEYVTTIYADGTISTYVETMDPPYETRTVFADHDFGHLGEASDASNYTTTVGPDQDPQAYATGGPTP